MNEAGLKLLKSLEGCRLTAYKLGNEKYYTIGYGHNGADVKKDMTITQAEADELFLKDLAKFEKYVDTYALKKFGELTGNQHAALTSYCYNRGLGGLKQLLAACDTISQVPAKMVELWGSNTTYKTALINRRKKEAALFSTGAAGGEYYPKYTGYSNQLDVVFKAIGAPYGNYTKRRPVAIANGITNYVGAYGQNVLLLRLAKAGELRRA